MPPFTQRAAAFFLRFIFIALLTGSGLHTCAQAETDTLTFDTLEPKVKGSIFKGRPGKSFLFSMVIPGSGQIYNKSYLRVPFVWAAVGGMGYVLHYNSCRYVLARDAYKAAVDGVPHIVPDKCSEAYQTRLENASVTTLRSIRDAANENRQLSIIGFSLVWLANGIDAFVDAHLKDFNVDDDLSINFSTRFDNDPYVPMRVGMFLTLK